MTKTIRNGAIALLAFLAAATAATAEPIKLKLAFFSSDRAAPFQAAIKPFMDAVNADARGLVEIELYPSGVLAKGMAAQAKLVLDGGADLAFIVPGYTPDLFPDNAVIELPGLFRDGREATYVSLAALPYFLAKFLVGPTSGYLLQASSRSRRAWRRPASTWSVASS